MLLYVLSFVFLAYIYLFEVSQKSISYPLRAPGDFCMLAIVCYFPTVLALYVYWIFKHRKHVAIKWQIFSLLWLIGVFLYGFSFFLAFLRLGRGG